MRRLWTLLLLCLCAPTLLAADALRFQPLLKPVPAPDAPPQLTVLAYHDIPLDLRQGGDLDSSAITLDHLVAHFDWLHANGYHMVSVQQVVDAMAGKAALPPKAVLLSFDDGLESFYTHVYPLLRAYHYPAMFALEGSWLDLKPGETFDYNGKRCTRACFVSWEQVREMQASGLVEIASHTYDLHHGLLANPQGNQLPAAVSLRYDPKDGQYENAEAFRQRIRDDLARSAQQIEQHTGKRPRAVVWPYGAYNRVAREEAAAVGLSYSFSLEARQPESLAPAHTVPRLLVGDNIGVTGLATMIYQHREVVPQRVVQVDLDYVYDPDPVQQEKNLGRLLDRIKRLAPSQVWLQAYADPKGDGVAEAVYFPNRLLPMRADLFSRVSWQLRTRAGVQVYAWMPVLAFRFPGHPDLPTLGSSHPAKGEDPYRLAPWDPTVQKLIGDLYEDLAMHAPMAGLLFSDDAFMRDSDNLGPWKGLPAAQRTARLIDFTAMLTARVRQWRTQIATARNIYAAPVLDPRAEAWFAQSLPAFNAAYDYTALMAMPQLDKQPPDDRWFLELARRVMQQPDGLDRTVFELAATNWQTRQPIPAERIGARMRLLQAQGVRHLGYYPDDFIRGLPLLETIRPYISAASYPYQQR